jgi:serine/threonine-protein kinase
MHEAAGLPGVGAEVQLRLLRGPVTLSVATHSPTTFGKYRKIAVLGRGGMATVYLAAAQGPGGFTKLAVVKELKPELAEDPEFMAKFLDEARLAAMLSHPNVVQTFEVLTEADHHLIVMEYLEGQPLSRVRSKLAELGEVGIVAQLRVICDTLAGLHYAHELADYENRPLEVVHRDVSPHNVFVTYTGEAKVIDFGIAKAADASSLTRTGIIKGKLSYMSPEQASALPVDRRADVFATGVMIWEAAAGQRIWKGLEEIAIMHRLVTGEIPRLRDARPDASPVLDQICARALAPRAADRYATAEELRRELEAYIASCPQRVTNRELGEIVSRAFAEDRQKIKTVVDEQLRALRASASNPVVPVVPLAQLGPVHAGPPSYSASIASSFSAVSSPQSHSMSQTAVPAPRRTGLWVGVGAALVIGVLVAVGVTFAAKSGVVAGPTTTSPTTSATVPSTASTPVAANTPRKLTLSVTTVPPKATVTVDGNALAGPAEFPADGREHKVRVEAKGYEAQTETVVFDHDRTIVVTLDKKKTVGGGTTATTPHPTASSGEDPLGF